MCINPNAELELKGPKADLHLEVQNIAIEMTKPQVTLEMGRGETNVTNFMTFSNGLLSLQYTTMVELLESIDYMVKNAPYRKFRPEVSIHSSPKLWSVQQKKFTADGVWKLAVTLALDNSRGY